MSPRRCIGDGPADSSGTQKTRLGQ